MEFWELSLRPNTDELWNTFCNTSCVIDPTQTTWWIATFKTLKRRQVVQRMYKPQGLNQQPIPQCGVWCGMCIKQNKQNKKSPCKRLHQFMIQMLRHMRGGIGLSGTPALAPSALGGHFLLWCNAAGRQRPAETRCLSTWLCFQCLRKRLHLRALDLGGESRGPREQGAGSGGYDKDPRGNQLRCRVSPINITVPRSTSFQPLNRMEIDSSKRWTEGHAYRL